MAFPHKSRSVATWSRSLGAHTDDEETPSVTPSAAGEWGRLSAALSCKIPNILPHAPAT